MPSSVIIGSGGSGSGGSGSNASVGVNGAVAPTSSTEIGFINGSGNEVGVSATNPLPITGTITASNPSVGLTGSTAPTSATEIGVIDISGKLQGASASNPVRTDPTGTTLQPVSGTITANQGTSPWVVAGGGAAGAAVTGNPVLVAGTDGTNARTILTDTAGNTLSGRASSSNSSLATWTSATALNTVATVLSNNGEYDNLVITLNQTTTITGGQVTFQFSEDGTNWINALPLPAGAQTQNGIYVLTPNTYANFNFSISSFLYCRVLLSTAITGSGTVTIGYVLTAGANMNRHRVSLSRLTTIETTTPILANAVFTGQWHDAQAEGTNYVAIQSLSDKASAGNGLVLQESSDITNAGLTTTVANSSAAANTIAPLQGAIQMRYWRVVYTNGGTNQTTFELATTASEFQIPILGGNPATLRVIPQGTSIGENNKIATSVTVGATAGDAQSVAMLGWGGNFSGTAQGALQGWVFRRLPTIFKTAQATASGNTAVWTPGTGNKFRILKVMVQLTDNASLASGAVLTISFQDATTAMPIAFDIFVPTTAVTTTAGAAFTQELDLGDFGILSAAANNVFNVNLSAALATGNARIIAMGVEE